MFFLVVVMTVAELARTTKNMTIAYNSGMVVGTKGHDHRASWTELIDTCFSGTGTIENTGGMVPPHQHGMPKITNPFDWEQVVNHITGTSGRRMFEDSLGICRFPADFIDTTINTLNSITGWDFDLYEVMKVGRRIINLMRVYNFRCGLTGDKDGPSKRYGGTPVDGPCQGKSTRENWEKIKTRYYERMGWNTETGYPLDSTLEDLGIKELVYNK